MKTYKIKIHKHTPKRYRMSGWKISADFNGIKGFSHNLDIYAIPIKPDVTDLTKKPKGNIEKQIIDMNKLEWKRYKNFYDLQAEILKDWDGELSIQSPTLKSKETATLSDTPKYRKANWQSFSTPHKLGIFENIINKIRRK